MEKSRTSRAINKRDEIYGEYETFVRIRLARGEDPSEGRKVVYAG